MLLPEAEMSSREALNFNRKKLTERRASLRRT
jgi:hypothetical protein